MSTLPPPGQPPTELGRLTLERYILGQMREPERAHLASMAAQDPQLAARIRRIEAEIRDAAVGLPPLDLSLEPAASDAPPPRANRGRWALLVGTMMAVAAALGVVVGLPEDPATGEVFRGSFDLRVERVRLGAAVAQGMLVEVREGDRLQYTVLPGADGWLTVADVQDDGTVSLWLPPREVRAGEPVEAAVVLDGYAGKERVYFLLADDAIDRDAVDAAVRSVFVRPLADLDALPGLDAAQRSLLLVRGTE